jgi:hypothetical protein
MKKLFLMAAAAAALLTGCMDDNGGNNPIDGNGDGKASLTNLNLRLSGGGSLTRSLEGKGLITPGTNQIANAHVFILDAAGSAVINYAPVSASADLEALRGAGWMFPEAIPSDSKVYVLGNVHKDYNKTVRLLSTIDEIQAFTSDIWTQVDYNYSTMGNQGGLVADMTVTASGSARAEVRIAPVISRLELHSLKGEGNIHGYSVTGVFITNFYTAYTYGGGYPAGATAIDNTLSLAVNGGMTGDVPGYPVVAQGTETEPDALIASMTGNRIWAYNVVAKSLPLLIVRLENVMIGSRREAGPLYLTVTSYGSVTEFQAGKIYRIPELRFTEEHLALQPLADGGVTAEPDEWDSEDDLPYDLNAPSAVISFAPAAAWSDWDAAADATAAITFNVDPGTVTNWTASVSAGSPFTATAVDATSFTVAPDAANSSVYVRSASIIVNAVAPETGTSTPFIVRQAGAAPAMADAATTLADFAADGTDAAQTISFTSNVGYTAVLEGADADKFELGGVTRVTTDPIAGTTSYSFTVVAKGENVSSADYTATVRIVGNEVMGASATDLTFPVSQLF